ncbi:unnamed protein product [Miscanthus lutarioriparius]|uniref:Uncharacterized protein n=1 Tax=Miscanthus lutarioriparius TaxID=422564 RepID=A0A811MHA8_9POAL|nr:unnamed protein product [Miscanthus lutarioriparius]
MDLDGGGGGGGATAGTAGEKAAATTEKTPSSCGWRPLTLRARRRLRRLSSGSTDEGSWWLGAKVVMDLSEQAFSMRMTFFWSFYVLKELSAFILIQLLFSCAIFFFVSVQCHALTGSCMN